MGRYQKISDCKGILFLEFTLASSRLKEYDCGRNDARGGSKYKAASIPV